MTLNLNNLADVLRARGLKVAEVAGWQGRGYKGQKLVDFRGVLWHHTATASARGLTAGMPTLNVLRDGHANLAGPLSQLGLGRDGTVHVVAGGLSNHAGTGSAPGIPINAGNWHMLGIEMESSGTAPWDWTPAQLAAAPKLGAALELAYMASLPASQRVQMGHMEYSDAGKIDPAGWPGGMNGLRASINAQIAAWSKTPPKPAPAPAKPAAVKPAAAKPSVQTGLVNRYVTNDNAYLLTRPTTAAPTYAVFPKGTPLAIKGYVGGQDPYGTGDTAWYVTGSGHYVWANAAEDNVAGLRFLGNM